MDRKNVNKIAASDSSEVIERLDNVIRGELHTTIGQFAEQAKVSNFHKMMRGEIGFSPQTLRRIDENTRVNVNYIKTGEGEHLKDMPLKSDGIKLKPRILNYANAGTPTVSLTQNIEEYAPAIKQLPDYDCTIVIRGDSMEPTYHSGDELAVKNVTDTGYRQWGTPHLLNTSQGIVVKRIYPDEENKGYKCVSDNKKYPTFVIPESDVYSVYKVVGLVRWGEFVIPE